MMPESASRTRRSLLYRWHAQNCAHFGDIHGAMFVEHYGNSDDEVAIARQAGLCDLSLLPRFGLTGPDASTELLVHGYRLPEFPNHALRQDNGDIVARLSANEYLQLSHCTDAATTSAMQSPDVGRLQGSYLLPRADSHSLFVLCGHFAAEVLSKLCGIDCRTGSFVNGRVAQTSVARQNGIIIRDDLGQTPGYLLLSATPAAEYLWDCVIDAMSEFGGQAIGIAALHRLEIM